MHITILWSYLTTRSTTVSEIQPVLYSVHTVPSIYTVYCMCTAVAMCTCTNAVFVYQQTMVPMEANT